MMSFDAKVSVKAAREEYGVAVTPARINAERTRHLRDLTGGLPRKRDCANDAVAGLAEESSMTSDARQHWLRLTWLIGITGVSASAWAQPSLPPGPPIEITSVTQPLPTSQQYTLVDIPYFREIIPQRSGGRIRFKMSSMAEINLGGPEMLRLIRSGQADIGAASLSVVAGDAPFLDGTDLAGLNPTPEQARAVAEAFVPAANKELTPGSTQKIMGVYGFQAAILWCKKPVTGLADLKGRKVRSYGTSLPGIPERPRRPAGEPELPGNLRRFGAWRGRLRDHGQRQWKLRQVVEVTTSMYTLPLGWATAASRQPVLVEPSRSRRAALPRNHIQGDFGQAMEAWRRRFSDGVDCNMGIAAKCKLATLVTNNPMTETKPTAADEALLRKS